MEYALQHQPQDAEQLIVQRLQMSEALGALASATQQEAAWLAARVPAPTRAVMLAGGPLKNVPFMREISAIIGTVDANLFVDFVLGIPMLGWALHAPTQMRRDREPEETVEDLLARSQAKNLKLISRTRASGDERLDREAWRKTMEEMEMGLMSPPVFSLADLGLSQCCLVRRHGLWEQHGAAVAPTVRVLDDFLEGGQNGTVGYQYTHRPANLDTVTATLRTVGERYLEPLEMFTSDFAKAFKQVPGVEAMLHLSVVVQWDPTSRRPAFLIPYTQVFGGRSTPLNFARFPVWCCHAMAVLAALPCEHCVDDMISAERKRTMRSGWIVWRLFADHCGWRVPDVKSPDPSPQCIALGAEFDLVLHPEGPMSVRIHDARIEAISFILAAIQKDGAVSFLTC